MASPLICGLGTALVTALTARRLGLPGWPLLSLVLGLATLLLLLTLLGPSPSERGAGEGAGLEAVISSAFGPFLAWTGWACLLFVLMVLLNLDSPGLEWGSRYLARLHDFDQAVWL